MAEAMIKGVLDARLAEAADIQVGEPVEARRDYLSETYGLRVESNNSAALDGTDLVVLSVKPQSLGEVVADVGPKLKSDQAVLSIMAGVRMDTLTSGLKHKPVVRVMPNTPAQIGRGMTVWTASDDVPEDQIEASREILATLGEELYVAEEKFIDMATALSASGPAYVFLFIESLIDAGVYLGMPRDMARKLVLQTVSGSADLVVQTGRHPSDLKDMVTSPGGTTAEALRVFEEAGFTGVGLAGCGRRLREVEGAGGLR